MIYHKLKGLTVHELSTTAAGHKVIKVHVLSLLCKAVEESRPSRSRDVKAKFLHCLKCLISLDSARAVVIYLTEHNLNRERKRRQKSADVQQGSCTTTIQIGPERTQAYSAVCTMPHTFHFEMYCNRFWNSLKLSVPLSSSSSMQIMVRHASKLKAGKLISGKEGKGWQKRQDHQPWEVICATHCGKLNLIH